MAARKMKNVLSEDCVIQVPAIVHAIPITRLAMDMQLQVHVEIADMPLQPFKHVLVLSRVVDMANVRVTLPMHVLVVMVGRVVIVVNAYVHQMSLGLPSPLLITVPIYRKM